MAVVERHRRLDSGVEAGIGLARTKAFELVELRENRFGVEHAMHLASHAVVR